MQLAELNISRWKIDDTSEVAQVFWDNVERINSLAERSTGFVWRLTDEKRDEQGRNAICEDNQTVMTLSVWQSANELEHFVWNTVHKQIYNQKSDWFGNLESHHFVMWHVEEGHEPDIEEAAMRLQYLNENGNSDYAFGWSHLPHVKLWQQQQCA